MDLVGFYAALTTRDMERAEDWWTRLTGWAPTDRPMDGLIQWRGGGAGLQIFRDEETAGKGRITIVIRNMDVERTRLKAAGIELEPDQKGDYGVIAQTADPDGNRVTFAEPPKGYEG